MVLWVTDTQVVPRFLSFLLVPAPRPHCNRRGIRARATAETPRFRPHRSRARRSRNREVRRSSRTASQSSSCRERRTRMPPTPSASTAGTPSRSSRMRCARETSRFYLGRAAACRVAPAIRVGGLQPRDACRPRGGSLASATCVIPVHRSARDGAPSLRAVRARGRDRRLAHPAGDLTSRPPPELRAQPPAKLQPLDEHVVAEAERTAYVGGQLGAVLRPVDNPDRVRRRRV